MSSCERRGKISEREEGRVDWKRGRWPDAKLEVASAKSDLGKGAAASEEGRDQREKIEEGREQRGMREERREERDERREKSAERSEKRDERRENVRVLNNSN